MPYPSYLDDDSFDVNRHIPRTGQEETSLTVQSSPFLHIIQFRRLSGRILASCNNFTHLSAVPSEETRRLRHKLEELLSNWRDEAHQLVRTMEAAHYDMVSCFVSFDWYNAAYNNAMLLLYRPTTCLSVSKVVTHPDAETPDLQILLRSSKASLESYDKLFRDRKLECSWMTIHDVFNAGLTYIYSVEKLLKDSTTHQLIPSILSIVDLTRLCSNILVAICERCGVCRAPSELFNKISNAMIQDALNISSGPAVQTPLSEGMPPMNDGVLSPQPVPKSAPSNPAFRRSELSLEIDSPSSMLPFVEPMSSDEDKSLAVLFELSSQKDGTFPIDLLCAFPEDWPVNMCFSSQKELTHTYQVSSPSM